MNRVIELNTLLPPYLRVYKDLNAIMDAETSELQRVENEHAKIVDNRYIDTCNEDGIKRFETLMNITPSTEDTLDTRKARCKSIWNRTIPYNYQVLENKLKMLCGETGYQLRIDFDSQTITIAIDIVDAVKYQDVVNIVTDITPCNMILNISQLFNNEVYLSQFPHFILMQFTHEELRNIDLYAHLSGKVDNVAKYTVGDVDDLTVEQLTKFGFRKVD